MVEEASTRLDSFASHTFCEVWGVALVFMLVIHCVLKKNWQKGIPSITSTIWLPKSFWMKEWWKRRCCQAWWNVVLAVRVKWKCLIQGPAPSARDLYFIVFSVTKEHKSKCKKYLVIFGWNPSSVWLPPQWEAETERFFLEICWWGWRWGVLPTQSDHLSRLFNISGNIYSWVCFQNSEKNVLLDTLLSKN